MLGVGSAYMENLLPECQDELKRVKDLLREVVMRQQLAHPETLEDTKWFDEEIKGMPEKDKAQFLVDIYKVLGLGKIDS